MSKKKDLVARLSDSKKPIVKNEFEQMRGFVNHYYCPDCRIVNGKKRNYVGLKRVNSGVGDIAGVVLECPHCNYSTMVSSEEYGINRKFVRA